MLIVQFYNCDRTLIMGETSGKCMTDVPDDLLLHMFKYLSVKDLCHCERHVICLWLCLLVGNPT